MHKGTIEITNKGLGFKLINSMSFGEFMFPAGFIQKTTMSFGQRKYRNSTVTATWEGSRRLHEALHQSLG
jgi:hypothetical protein